MWVDVAPKNYRKCEKTNCCTIFWWILEDMRHNIYYFLLHGLCTEDLLSEEYERQYIKSGLRGLEEEWFILSGPFRYEKLPEIREFFHYNSSISIRSHWYLRIFFRGDWATHLLQFFSGFLFFSVRVILLVVLQFVLFCFHYLKLLP